MIVAQDLLGAKPVFLGRAAHAATLEPQLISELAHRIRR